MSPLTPLLSPCTSPQDHLELELETLHLTVALIDRMLALRPVSIAKLQLVGVACLVIASKVVERYPPKVSFFYFKRTLQSNNLIFRHYTFSYNMKHRWGSMRAAILSRLLY